MRVIHANSWETIELGEEFEIREFTIEGFEEFGFYSHKDVNANGGAMDGWWVVTEEQTGMRIPTEDARTRDQAEILAANRLRDEGITPERLREIIADGLRLLAENTDSPAG